MATEKPETPQLAEALKIAYAGTLRHGAQLLAVWKSNLSSERSKQLSTFEANGQTLGLLIGVPDNRVTVQVIMSDARGGIQILDEISITGH